MSGSRAPAHATGGANEARDARVQPTGTLLDGKFRVVGLLGAGSAGVVYEIVHEETRLRRALRVLDQRESTPSSDNVDDALRQADAAGRLRHPHLVEVFAVGRLGDGSPYILMELLQGVTLTQRIKETEGLSLEELGEVLGQACDGLQAAHDAGLLLRDLRPEKVFITSGAGRPLVKLLDVGLARLGAKSTGVHRYQPPEQKGDPAKATARSDVFALGLMLYEAASGQYPDSSRDAPATLDKLNPRLPAALAELASSAMEADPARRPPTARAFGDALRVITRDASVDPLGKTLPVTDGELLKLEATPPPAVRVTRSAPNPSPSSAGRTPHAPAASDLATQRASSERARPSAPPPARRGSTHLKNRGGGARRHFGSGGGRASPAGAPARTGTSTERQPTVNRPSSPESPALPVPGEVLAHKYRVERVLGAGGMGVVVAAMHLSLQERVALKFLHPNMASPEALARFVREARTAAKIKSEHVARVTDVGTLDSGAPYMVMEYLEGSDLGRVLTERGHLPIRDAVEYVVQACDALAEAHTLGIVHRDLKPANLFLTTRAGGQGVVKVLDFGISKVTNSAPLPLDEGAMVMTKTRAWLGSPLYMSPEQMRSPRDVDARADVWSLGVILFELLSGQMPFNATTFPELCAQIMHQAPVPLLRVRPDVPVALAEAVARCLEKDPAHRYQSVAELVMALVAFGPRRARSIAERAVALSEAAGLVAKNQAPRVALDGTLPEPIMSPLRGMTRDGAATRAPAPPPPPTMASTTPPLEPLAVTRAPQTRAAATGIGLFLVVACVLSIGFYLRARHVPDPITAPVAGNNAAPVRDEPPAPPAPPTVIPEVAASVAPSATAPASSSRAAASAGPAPTATQPVTAARPTARAKTAPTASAATASPAPVEKPTAPQPGAEIGNERCFATQPDGSRVQVPCH